MCDALLRANVCTFLESYLSENLNARHVSIPYNHFKRFQLLFIMFSSCFFFYTPRCIFHSKCGQRLSGPGWTYRKNSFDFGWGPYSKDLISILIRVCRKRSLSSCIFDQYEFWMECTFFGWFEGWGHWFDAISINTLDRSQMLDAKRFCDNAGNLPKYLRLCKL